MPQLKVFTSTLLSNLTESFVDALARVAPNLEMVDGVAPPGQGLLPSAFPKWRHIMLSFSLPAHIDAIGKFRHVQEVTVKTRLGGAMVRDAQGVLVVMLRELLGGWGPKNSGNGLPELKAIDIRSKGRFVAPALVEAFSDAPEDEHWRRRMLTIRALC